jgi:hypothetical protein
MPVIDRDRGMASTLLRLRALHNTRVKVGVLEAAGASDSDPGVTVAQVAAWNEFGVEQNKRLGIPGIPERPFIRGGIDDAKPLIYEAVGKLTGLVIDGKMEPDVAAKRLGLLGVREIQKKLLRGPFVANAPSTIAIKGSSRPLVDTGQLRRSISFAVVSPFANATEGQANVADGRPRGGA